jgi:hypothetical protein
VLEPFPARPRLVPAPAEHQRVVPPGELVEHLEQIEEPREATARPKPLDAIDETVRPAQGEAQADSRPSEQCRDVRDLGAVEEALAEEVGCELDDDRPLRAGIDRAVGRPRVRQVGPQEDEIGRRVPVDALADEPAPASRGDQDQLALGVVVPDERERRDLDCLHPARLADGERNALVARLAAHGR